MHGSKLGLVLTFAFGLIGAATTGAVAKDRTLDTRIYQLADNKPGKGPKSIPPGQIIRQKNGPKPIPPGQLKKWGRGTALPPGGWVYIDDLSYWRLSPLPPGQGYVRIDDEVIRVWRDGQTVIEAIGIVGDLLR